MIKGHFGNDKIKFNNSEMKINFEYILSESAKRVIIKNLNILQKEHYKSGDFLSKKETGVEISRVIAKENEIKVAAAHGVKFWNTVKHLMLLI
ncbi:hypothetical protein QNH16_20455 [Peribacillus frigoritolerans]|uniref:hypothetical protein n=1 Tax=Peribacillus frigoritolerans TaxID=450367 RepID=UPI0024C02825|nr:hypothetical protein [Peribacillus frigoritolerans]WHY13118.1 hypothetical protein QNH16_20455 [Peribacillus frigoritolerans]